MLPFIEVDLSKAIVGFLESAPPLPKLLPEFWANPQAVDTIASLAKSLELAPDQVLLPAAWHLWLSNLSKEEYLAECSSPNPSPLVKSFRECLAIQPIDPVSILADLSKEEPLEVTAGRLGLLSVVPGKAQTAQGEVSLWWIGDEGAVLEIDGVRVDVPREQQGIGYRVLSLPTVLGRSLVQPSDSLPINVLPEQQALVSGLALSQSVWPKVGIRSESASWLTSPPAWVSAGHLDTALHYLVAKTLFGVESIPVTAVFRNPSTMEACLVQAPILGASPAGEQESEVELKTVDFVMGVVSRKVAVRDGGGKVWWPGPVELWASNSTLPAEIGKLPSPATLRSLLLRSGCSIEKVKQAVSRLAVLAESHHANQ